MWIPFRGTHASAWGFQTPEQTAATFSTLSKQLGNVLPGPLDTNTPGSKTAGYLLNLSTFDSAHITLDGTSIALTVTKGFPGHRALVFLTQDATGSRTVTWSGVTWSGGTAPTLTTTAHKCDVIELTVVAQNPTTIFGRVWGSNF